MLERLDQRFRLLGPGGRDRTAHPRHQALGALFDWSYELCTNAERTAWRQLSLCSGGVLLTDAEQLSADVSLSTFDAPGGSHAQGDSASSAAGNGDNGGHPQPGLRGAPLDKPVPSTGWPVLKTDQRSEEVRSAQLLLASSGHHIAHDGVFGPATAAAASAFQRGHDLPVNGSKGCHRLQVRAPPRDHGLSVRHR
ncbi:peptidoglycan-binding protein [Streptomyces sp. NPDC012486]|uniref:peptidoglycan-binding domain-containing protein n=1 Tax=unclassified Streptomyces TaxID=2593676 RepID=UPI0033CED965